MPSKTRPWKTTAAHTGVFPPRVPSSSTAGCDPSSAPPRRLAVGLRRFAASVDASVRWLLLRSLDAPLVAAAGRMLHAAADPFTFPL